MSHKHPFAWRGATAPKRSGGLVDGIALNEGPKPLAVDPDGVTTTDDTRSAPSGPQLDLERMDDEAAGPVQRNGRVRLTRT